eukprot:sb/3464805/
MGIYDELELPADQFDVMVNLENHENPLKLGEALAASGVLKEVQENLGIDCERFDLIAEQNTITLMSKGAGGEFKKHNEDEDEMIGTLVVQLPGSYYEGGAMKIAFGDSRKKLVLEGHKPDQLVDSSTSESSNQNELHVSAFLSKDDQHHRVLNVDEGTRLTVEFSLQTKKKLIQIEPCSSADLSSTVLQKHLNPSERESLLAAKFVELCHDEAFLPGYLLDPVSFAFPCYHLYSNEEIFQNSTALDPLDWAQAAQLKGQDAVLVKAVLDAGSCRKTNGSVEVYMQPILECHYIPVGGHLNSNDNVQETSVDQYRADKFPDRCTRAKMDDDCTEIWDEFGVEDFDENDHDKIIWVFDQKLGHEPSSLGETEMECSNGKYIIKFYVSTFLWVKFEPFEDRYERIHEGEIDLLKSCKPGQKRKGGINMKVSKKRFYDSRY